MYSDSKQRLAKWLAVPVLAIVLVVLAVLQYRWSNQVSATTRAQIQSNLEMALMGFRMDLTRELGTASMELRPALDLGAIDPHQISQLYHHWQDTTSHPSLISQIYVWSDADGKNLKRLNEEKSQWEKVEAPAELRGLTKYLPTEVPGHPLEHNPPPFQELHDLRRRPHDDRGHRPNPPWFVNATIPALIYPVRHEGRERPEKRQSHRAWMIVELNASVLRSDIFPELVQKYFKGSSGLDYHVAIVTGNNGAHILYASDHEFSQGDATSDASLNLVGPPFSPGQEPPPPGVWPMERFNQQTSTHFDRLVRFEPLDRSADGVWKLVVRHQRGSVEAAVAALRRRNLAVSFGVLLLLAASMGIIMISSQRANRLAQLQMDFVAGVSHEVRTPLAVISSAAENMAHGVIADKDQIVRYGNSILNQTRQLSHLVEQVLQFATVRQSGRKYELRPTDVHEAVAAALENSATVTRKAGVAIEVSLADDLPSVMADFTALVQSLQNLITNAAKYGASGGWIRVSSTVKQEKGKPVELQISVADKGMGISNDELRHIFEPFYRSPSVAGSQIHGTGLGLPLTRAAIEAMGGHVTAESELNRGSIFTIRLPVMAEQEAAEQTTHRPLNTPAEDPAL